MKSDMEHKKIKELLDNSLSRIEQPALDRLRDIRRQSLAHYAARAAAPSLVTTGLGMVLGTQRRSYYWIASVLLAACLVSGITYWHHGTEHSTAEEDIAILTDDLPLHMYVE